MGDMEFQLTEEVRTGMNTGKKFYNLDRMLAEIDAGKIRMNRKFEDIIVYNIFRVKKE